MIIVKLIGGLGNQMFQYAAAKALANRHGVALKVDITFLNADTSAESVKRDYELAWFKLKVESATETEIQNFKKLKSSRLLRVFQRQFPFLFSKIYFAESGHQYHNNFESMPNEVYMDGYWQSEKYFETVKTELLKDFELKQALPEVLNVFLEKIKNTNSVSIHVRRGDYVASETTASFHGLCSVDYYQRAVKHIKQKAGTLELFVFSDDLRWCKQNFLFTENVNFVEHNQNGVWDLFLMSQCKHHIIANSSFSWWGAWLNQADNKIVCAPENWFANKLSSEMDIIPPGWTVVK